MNKFHNYSPILTINMTLPEAKEFVERMKFQLLHEKDAEQKIMAEAILDCLNEEMEFWES